VVFAIHRATAELAPKFLVAPNASRDILPKFIKAEVLLFSAYPKIFHSPTLYPVANPP
jgi:hypothetical protein